MRLNEIELKTKLELNDLIKFNYYTIIFRNKLGPFFIFIPTAMWLAVIYYCTDYVASYEPFPVVQLIFALFFTVGMPLLIYFTAKSTMENNPKFNETISYKLTEERIVISGARFIENMSWDKVVNFEETRTWFLIYAHELAAIIIKKNELTADEIRATRSLVKTIPGLNYKLKA